MFSFWSRARAASIRASDSSRPSRARLSKIPADTVRPVSATRNGWNRAPGFTPRRSATARSACSTCCSSNGSTVASASRAAASASAAPSLPITLSQAAWSISTGPNAKPTSRGISARVETLSCTAATACSSCG